ncbi:MAG: L-threonylcarbamoyladenylate synthase [Bacteroidetes bacterium]|nr:L-threonylcarbamoyladenylate synthase [Bacteroidota bacterium]MCL1969647.1 L-threonylcarbamoyladenylate synthase [Bacteroidota bacterium]
MEQEILKCKELLLQGKIILYPTDTVWGIGCDATNEAAIKRIYAIKQRQESKSMIILLDAANRLPLYVAKIPLIAWDLITHTYRPTTYIYPTAQNLPQQLIHPDGTIAIRITNNPFCKKLIKALERPIISTSANASGEPTPVVFSEISQNIIELVDYVVPQEYANSIEYKPSRLVKFIDDYNFAVIRE